MADEQLWLRSGFGLLQAIFPINARALTVARKDSFAFRKTPFRAEFL